MAVNDIENIHGASLDYWWKLNVCVSTKEYERLSALVKDTTFTVAGIRQMKVLNEIHKGIYRAIETGSDFRAFKRQLLEKLASKKVPKGVSDFERSLHSDKAYADRDRKLRTVFDTSMSRAYNAGRWRAAQEALRLEQPRLIVYDVIDGERGCEGHQALDGMVRYSDDPVWKSHWPPNGFNCRCSVMTMPSSLAKNHGILPSANDDVSLRMGLVEIHPDFAVAPGSSVTLPHLVAELEALAERSWMANPTRAVTVLSENNDDKSRQLAASQSALTYSRNMSDTEMDALERDFGIEVEAKSIAEHGVTSRGLEMLPIGVFESNAADWAGQVAAASSGGIKKVYRQLIKNEAV